MAAVGPVRCGSVRPTSALRREGSSPRPALASRVETCKLCGLGRGRAMTDRRALAAIVCLLIGACSRPAPDASRNAQVSSAATETAAAAPTAPAAKPAGCSDKIQVVLDGPSLIDAGDKPFPAARIAAFETKAAAAFHHAADDACKNAFVRKALGPITRLVVQSGSGAT